MNPEERLKKLMRDTGEVNAVYGGFEIKVFKPTLFSWHKVFNQLIEIDQNIWVNRREGRLYITSEPKIR